LIIEESHRQYPQMQHSTQSFQRQSIPQLVQRQSMPQTIQRQPIQQTVAQPTQYFERPQPVRTVSHPTQNTQFSNLIETTSVEIKNAPKKTFPAVYEPYQTYEHDTSIPYLHPIEIPQYIHDTKYVNVPVPQIQIVEKPVIKERIVTVAERPTEMHHITLTKDREAGPNIFMETVEEDKGWPWWWWLPLLLLGLCLPLCCLGLWYLYCRKAPEAPEPIRIPQRVVQKAAPAPQPRPQPRVVDELQQRKKFTYTKNEIDQEREIEDEIQRELNLSRIRKTDTVRDRNQRPVVYHHSRYIEKPRLVEEQNMGVYDRTATYDAVNRQSKKYAHVDDSYYVQQNPQKVERVVETVYQPGVTRLDERRSRSPAHALRKSYVNPQYQAQNEVDDGRSGAYVGSPHYRTDYPVDDRRSGEGYVSREVERSPVRQMEVPRGQVQVVRDERIRQDGSPRMVGTTATRVVNNRYDGDGVGTGLPARNTRGEPRLREETKVQARSDNRHYSPQSYNSNQNLRTEPARVPDRATGGVVDMRHQINQNPKSSGRKSNFDDFDSEDDSY
jgi:hypothetical protein